MGLGEVVRSNSNDQGDVPTSFSRECHGKFWLHTWQSGFTLERGMEGFDTAQEMGDFRHVQYGTGDPDTGSWGTTMHGHLEPIAVPVIVRQGKLPPMDPEAESSDLQVRVSQGLFKMLHISKTVRGIS